MRKRISLTIRGFAFYYSYTLYEALMNSNTLSVKKLWYSLSLRVKLLMFFVAIVLAVSVIGLYSYTVAYKYIEEFQNTLQSHYRINTFLLELRKDYAALNLNMKSALPVDFTAARERQEQLHILLDWINRESNTGLEAYFQINALKNALGEYIGNSNNAIEERSSGGKNYIQPYYLAQRIFTYMEMYISDLQQIRLSEGWLYYYSLSRRSETTRALIIGIIACVALLSVRITFVFSRHFTAPIHTLAELSRRIASGELDVPLIDDPSHQSDEIGVLTASFNAMSKSIRTLVDDLTKKSFLEKKLHEEELEKESTLRTLRESQLISLQTQIKPHFLFNTLNTIARQAQLEKADESAALIRSLANLFRYNLISHQQTVTLETELAIVREYVDLQKKRFGERIQFKMLCAEGALNITIPPLIVQPFVENSVCHGIEPKIDGGILSIDVKKKKHRYVIRILDTGIGMDKETQKKLMDNKDDLMGGFTHGIGIRNVLMRLNLFYSGEERVEMHSKPGRGTLVILSLPTGRKV